MAIEPPVVITPAPTPAPQRGDRATFSDRVDGFVTWLTAAVGQFNAAVANVYNNATQAFNSANGAAISANSAGSAASNAQTSATSASASASSATASATTATARAIDAANSATAAMLAADSAAAVSGLPNPAGKPNYKMVVNSTGNGYTLVIDGAALGFVPVQQGGGAGQDTSKVFLGRLSGSASTLRATVAGVDIGNVVTSSTDPAIAVTIPVDVNAAAFRGAHYGDGSNLTNLGSGQITTALGFTPADAARFARGAITEMGQAIDFHYKPGSASDLDARISINTPNDDDPAVVARSEMSFLATRFYFNTISGGADVYAGTFYGGFFSGDGRFLTNFTSPQITNALGYVPSPIQNPILGPRVIVNCEPTNFDGTAQLTLRVSQTSGNTSNSAHMEFVKEGFYGVKVGLDGSNTFAIGGYSQGAGLYRFSVNPAGDAVAAGNVTSASDIRFKNEITRMTDVVRKILMLEMGGFEYLDNRTLARKYGVSAQDVQKVFPHAVVAGQDGYLSVAYGQLALALLIETTREFNERIEAQQEQINQLLKGN